jgi:Fe-S cluster assembly ATP-binding protein
MLTISKLCAGIEGTEILHEFDLTLKTGEIAALMGPNGSGKSTLAHVLAGHPSYVVESGSALLDEAELLGMEPEERAAAGLFLAFQYPASIPGVSVSSFLRLALNSQEKARGQQPTSLADFIRTLRTHMKQLQIPSEFASRSVNDGFSGGEKKRLEMLQMLVLQPTLVILDEIDSGLDIDAIKVVAEAVHLLDRSKTTILIITHYQRLLHYIKPDSVHVMKSGKIVRSGNAELALELEETGYEEV